MARIEFTNIYKVNVLDQIQKLIKQTIPSIPLYYDEHRGQESFLLRPVSDNFIDYASNTHIRSYETEISFEIESGSDFTRDKDVLRMTNIAELVKRIFFNNRNLEDYWYSARVISVVYQRDEEDTEKERFILTLECNVNEVIS
tara:strand:+ start:354 stop:782 length:429 start_codon:yes stop_codon:yes gene_type:complete